MAPRHLAPLCDSFPFQNEVMACPLAKVQVKVQLEMARVLVLLRLNATWNPPLQESRDRKANVTRKSLFHNKRDRCACRQ